MAILDRRQRADECLLDLDINERDDRDTLILHLCMDETGPMLTRTELFEWAHRYFPGPENLLKRSQIMLAYSSITKDTKAKRKKMARQNTSNTPVQPEETAETAHRQGQVDKATQTVPPMESSFTSCSICGAQPSNAFRRRLKPRR